MSDPALTRRFRRRRLWINAGMATCFAVFFGSVLAPGGWKTGPAALWALLVSFLLMLALAVVQGTYGSLCPRCRRWLARAKAVEEADEDTPLTAVLKACPYCRQEL